MSHIPYYGEEEDKVVVKSNNKLVALAAAALLVVNPVSAKDVKKVVYQYGQQEEVIVHAVDLSKIKQKHGNIPVGLNQEVLVHIYDEKTDSWKYVDTKQRHKK